MGGTGLRGAHTERRCAGVVDAVGVAGGEMSEDPLDDLGSVDAGDDAQRGATHSTVFDVDVEDALEALHPAHGGRRRVGLAGGWMSPVGDDVVAVFEVRGEVIGAGVVGLAVARATGIVDVHEYMLALEGDAEANGAMVALESPCLGGAVRDDGIRIDVGGDEPVSLVSDIVVNAAALGAQDVARRIEGLDPAHIPLRGACRRAVASSVYPSATASAMICRSAC